MKSSWLALALLACGPVKGAPADAGDDAPSDGPPDSPGPACDLAKPFAPAVAIPNLHAPSASDVHATLSADERTIFFASDRDSMPGAQTFHIYTASRPSVTAEFGPPTVVGSLFSTEGESHPSVSPDGNTIFFDSFRVTQGTVHIFTATRSSVAVEFTAPRLIPGDFLIDPAITPDLEIIYAANLSTGRLSRMDRAADGMFGAPQDVAIPFGSSIVSPVTNDDLTMFLSLGDTRGNKILVTRRASLADPFPAPTAVPELDIATVVAEPSWLSPDGCRLYLTYGLPGAAGTVLHVATRPQ